jgi:ribonuclease BN (tRNA processing enzyme)
MKLEFLGVGNFFARTHHQTNLLVNDRILVDCGMTAGRALFAAGRTFSDVDHIFITHTHADHIGGLEECAFHSRFIAGGRKPHLHLPEELMTTLWDHSLRAGLEDPEGGACRLEDYFQVHLAERRFQIDGLQLEITPTRHVPGKFCCGLRLDGTVYFSGDTQYEPEKALAYGEDAAAIFHDCQFAEGGIHASLSQLAGLPAHLRRKTLLVHYPDGYADHEEAAARLGFGWARERRPYIF